MREASAIRPRFALLRSIFALMLREMSSTYGRSPGGYAWAFVEPVGGIALLTAIFSIISRTPPLGDNFPYYFAGGILPFMMYQTTANSVGAAIRYSKPLLTYPRVTYIDALLARLLLGFLTQVLISLVLFSFIIGIYGLRPQINFLLSVEALVMATVLGFGVGTVNCFLMSMLPIWKFVWAVLNRPLFIISGIFFLIDPLPENLRNMLLYNPVAHTIMQMRNGLFDIYDAPYVSRLYVYMTALVLTALGMLLLNRYHRIILDEGS